MSTHEATVYARQVAGLVQKRDPGLVLPPCGDSNCQWMTTSLNFTCMTKPRGQLPPAVVCADSLAAMFRNGASVLMGSAGQGSGAPGSQGSGHNTKWQPLGEIVSVNMELAGLKGRPVFLSWSIFQEGGQNHLPGNWLGNFVAYRLDETTNDDTGTLEIWIPLPKQPGPYFVQLTMTTGAASLASMNSGSFD